jgi:hypothetical protein
VPSDISISPVAATWLAQPLRTGVDPTAGNAAAAQAQSAGVNLATIPNPVNPGFHLDPALNIVVLQFYDAEGNVTQSIPSQKQLDAYRTDDGASAGHATQKPDSKLL